MKTKERASKTSSNTAGLRVSRKFYAYIMSRIAESASLLSETALTAAVAMQAVDDYIIKGVTPLLQETSTEVMLIFTILRPEIDRAISRSTAARRRVVTRNKPKMDSPADPCQEKCQECEDISSETEPVFRPFQNRRMRREQMQEIKRSRRKKQRREAAMAKSSK